VTPVGRRACRGFFLRTNGVTMLIYIIIKTGEIMSTFAIILTVSVLLYLIGRMFNALEDTIRHPWKPTIFSTFSSRFWREWFAMSAHENDLWRKPGAPLLYRLMMKTLHTRDAWHFSKMVRITAYTEAIILPFQVLYGFHESIWVNIAINILALFAIGMPGNLTFNTFYGKSKYALSKGLFFQHDIDDMQYNGIKSVKPNVLLIILYAVIMTALMAAAYLL